MIIPYKEFKMSLTKLKSLIISEVGKNNFKEVETFTHFLIFVKKMTLEYDNLSDNSSKQKSKTLGFNLPYTSNYNFIMRHIDRVSLFDVINDSLKKIKKRNPNFNLIINETNQQFSFLEKNSEMDIEKNTLINIIREIDSIQLSDLQSIYIFLNDELPNIINEKFLRYMDYIEKNKTIIFKGDIPISINNSVIFDKTFIVEQWIRRIIMFSLMLEYGKDWISVFEDDSLVDYARIRGKITEKEIIESKDDNLLWYTTLGYLAKFIKRKDISNKIKTLTNLDTDTLSKSIFKISIIRNEMAHNRTITKAMEQEYNQNFDRLKTAIVNFKSKIIYTNTGKIVSNYSTSYINLVNYFKKKSEEFNKIQAYLEDNTEFYSLVFLPSHNIEFQYIDIEKLLEIFKHYKNSIIAFYVNKSCDEYQIIISKKIKDYDYIYKEIINIFFESLDYLGTSNPYEIQDSKYTCNPRIWFYELDFNSSSVNEIFK